MIVNPEIILYISSKCGNLNVFDDLQLYTLVSISSKSWTDHIVSHPILFSIILLNSIYLKISRNATIEGLETKNTDKTSSNDNSNTNDDDDEDIKQRFNKLQEKVNKIQDQIVDAEKSNNENARTLTQLKNKS